MITVVGGGLVGSLLATGLAKRGHEVELLERRSDMRKGGAAAGRSINLAVSVRGIHALRTLGLEQEVLARAIPMQGRMMHSPSGELTFQRYGVEDWQSIYSISRAELNRQLLTAAERTGKVRIGFDTRLERALITDEGVELDVESGSGKHKLKRERVIGTDGSASPLRTAVMQSSGSSCTEELLDYGYKELAIPPGDGGTFRMEKNALHIWPRGNFMLIALPNFDGSFTCTLFLPYRGPQSFEGLKTREQVRAFFDEHFRDAVPLLDRLEEAFFENPTGHMVTVRCKSWNAGGPSGDKALLMGDAAHAIVPFFGQGMNCGFEDCSVFFEKLDQGMELEKLFAEMTRVRPANASAIADLAIENFLEMRDKVGDQQFLREKALEKRLQMRFPREYISRYSLVSFSRVPYTVALEAGVAQSRLLARACPPGADPEKVDLDALASAVRSEIAPIIQPYLPEGLKP